MTNKQDLSRTIDEHKPLAQGIHKVSITLTLTTEAANNVQSVMGAVADLLKIACPTTFDIHQTLNDKSCTCSQVPFTHYSTCIYKIGRETSVNIQSLIDSQTKVCRYCTKLLLNENVLRKHSNECASNVELFIYFCNEQCYNAYQTKVHQPYVASTQIEAEPMDTTLPKELEEHLYQLNKIKRWHRWNPGLAVATSSQQLDTNEIDKLSTDIKIPLSSSAKEDRRICVFCNGIGDMKSNGPGRLLHLNIGQWCHLNCALWSSEVYEAASGALMGVEQAFRHSINIECVVCKQKGASLMCSFQRCSNKYHFACALDNGCVFYKNKTLLCAMHASTTIADDQTLDDKSVLRKVWIDRDEIKQIQNFMNEEHDDKSYILRIGSLILHNIGQLLPHQIQTSAFHNRSFIYPVGYTVTRFYWSMHQPNRRCAYICSIIDVDNKPMFRIFVEDNQHRQEFIESTAKAVWDKVVTEIDSLRQRNGIVKMFPVYIKGEDLFGLTEPHITRLIESLPGVEVLQNYAFKYGRLQLFDMPLTVNPTGCARSEPKLRTHFRRHVQALTSIHSFSRSSLPQSLYSFETHHVPYVKHFMISKSTQYRKLKTEWRQNVYLAKSRIQGLGLFAARDLEKNTIIIEYIGELIRNEVANKREKLYEQQNRGIYMFRLNDDYVIDATVSGCMARYVNHSCEPNSITEVVQVDKEHKIVIIANQRIMKGEEINYDYKFNFEDDCKIPCLCGSFNCRKWMN